MKKLIQKIIEFLLGTSIFWMPIVGSFIAEGIARLLGF